MMKFTYKNVTCCLVEDSSLFRVWEPDRCGLRALSALGLQGCVLSTAVIICRGPTLFNWTWNLVRLNYNRLLNGP